MTDSDSGPLFDGVDVEFLDGDLVVGRQALPRWVQPADDWHSGELAYHVYGFTGPSVQASGRQLFRVFVHPHAAPPDVVEQPPAEPAPT